jgi:hypothetical protein
VHAQAAASRGLVRGARLRDNRAMRLAAFVASILLASCASQEVVDRFDRVEPGMTRDEVISMLGKPSSGRLLTAARDGVDGERLQWGDSLSSLASSSVFEGDPDRAWSVVFDKDGKVIRAVPPIWVDAEREEARILRERREHRVGQQ